MAVARRAKDAPMTDEQLLRIEALFQELVELPPEERGAALGSEADSEVRGRVAAMLASLDAPSSLGEPFLMLDATDAALVEGRSTMIGRYKVLQRIGEGGFGTVYMAEQAEPVIRKVALKIIKLGMDTVRSSPASRPNGRPWR